MKNATAAPIVVEIPAKKDSNNASKTAPLTFSSPYFLVKATERARFSNPCLNLIVIGITFRVPVLLNGLL
jgi:hypothetical protein